MGPVLKGTLTSKYLSTLLIQKKLSIIIIKQAIIRVKIFFFSFLHNLQHKSEEL